MTSGPGLSDSYTVCLDPFPHCVIDDFLDRETVRQINAEWPTKWDKEQGSYQRKWSNEELPPTARSVVDSISPALVERVTGLEGLFKDPGNFGAGLHCIPHGGFLKMHVDFNVHPEGWHRRANMLIYLNEDWNPKWGGALKLGKKGQRSIDPLGGRCVIFETNEQSWHGHPEPLRCPTNRERRSLAIYFYSETEPDADPHSTVYIK